MEKIIESMKNKIRQVKEAEIPQQELQKTIKKRKLANNEKRRDIKFLEKNNEINMGKTSNSNAAMDRGSEKISEGLTLRKMLLIPKTEKLSNEKDDNYIPQHPVQVFQWNISTTCKEACRPK